MNQPLDNKDGQVASLHIFVYLRGALTAVTVRERGMVSMESSGFFF